MKVFAQAIFEEAREDFRAAKVLLSAESYSRSFLFSYTAVEKAMKAMLTSEGINTIADKNVSAIFAAEIVTKHRELQDGLKKVVYIGYDLEKKVDKTNYPHIIRNKIISPSELFSSEDALDAISKAQRVLEIISTYFSEDTAPTSMVTKQVKKTEKEKLLF